jgi:hypothetical protein
VQSLKERLAVTTLLAEFSPATDSLIYCYPYNESVYTAITGATTKTLYKLPYDTTPPNTTDSTHTVKFYAKPDRLLRSPLTGNFTSVIASKYSKLYNFWDLGIITDGHTIKVNDGSGKDYTKYLEFDRISDSDSGVEQLQIKFWDKYEQETDAYGELLPGKFLNYTDATTLGTGATFYPFTAFEYFASTDDNTLSIITNLSDSKTPVDYYPTTMNTLKTEFAVSIANKDKIEVGDYIVGYKLKTDGTKDYRLTKVLTKIRKYESSITNYVYYYTTILPVHTADDKVIRVKDIEDFTANYQMFHLDGFKMTSWHLPSKANKLAQMVKILGVLDEANTNLTKMLKDKDVIQFRYIVDTFDGSINHNTYPKTYITQLAMKRQKCLALMNAPSVQEFINSVDPRFTEEPSASDPKPIFNTMYIPDGGNLSLGPSFTFTLPDEANGSKYAGYFSPNLILRENGKNISVPPAAHVSNLYIQKFINGTPFHIVAGSKRGVISDPKLVGVEYDYLIEDREYIEPFGINPIIKKKNIGYMIFGNQMAYQKTTSAFNNLHVRDLLITVETGIEDILTNYLFEFNEDTIRLEIKTRVERYLEQVRSEGGIYDYAVIMDETNNTSEVIDQNFGILDVALEPARGMHKFINRITVMKTGGIASEGFAV